MVFVQYLCVCVCVCVFVCVSVCVCVFSVSVCSLLGYTPRVRQVKLTTLKCTQLIALVFLSLLLSCSLSLLFPLSLLLSQGARAVNLVGHN